MSPRFLYIVVIDDSPTICAILETVLTREGHEVKSFQNPASAIRSILKTSETPMPDLLFVDLSLPNMNGYEVIRFFKNDPASAHIPIIVITRLGDVIARLKVRLAGANVYLEKPFLIPDVMTLVRRFADFSNTHEK